MEFFGIGASELMVLLVIAIVMFGPDKIPTMAAQVGKTIREFRKYTSDLTKEFDAATGDLRKEFQDIAGDIKGEIQATQADLRSQLDLTSYLNGDAAAATVAAGATTATEAAPATLAVPSETETSVAVEPAPEQAETYTVKTAYAEALDDASETSSEPVTELATNGHTAPVVTKAEPLVDLVNLVVDEPHTEPETITEPANVTGPEPELALVTAAPSPGGTEPASAPRKAVGGSVAGSKYARRRSA
jgi:sec-independent protein translocase protein TatA